MYLVKRTNRKSDMTDKPPFGPGAPAGVAERAEVMEVWGSEFKDSGPDKCVCKLFDATGREIWAGEIPGF